MLRGRLGWETAEAARDGGCRQSFNLLDKGASSASRGCRGSSSWKLLEQPELEAAGAACAQRGLQERRKMESAGSLRRRLQEQLQAVRSAWLGDCWSSLRWRPQPELQLWTTRKARAVQAEAAGAARGSSGQLLREQRVKEAARAARDGGCRSS